MAILITLTSLSGGGKSEVFEYVKKIYPNIFPMNTYTSRVPRFDAEGGYEFQDKQYFIEHKDEFIELATYPPHSNPSRDDVHYYGKHKSQFDGRNYIMTMDEVGVLSLKKVIDGDILPNYSLVNIFIKCDDAVRLMRIGNDAKRDARDAKRKLLPDSSYDYVLDNSGTKEELFAQVDKIFKNMIR